jgi:hypothetical protein
MPHGKKKRKVKIKKKKKGRSLQNEKAKRRAEQRSILRTDKKNGVDTDTRVDD